MESSRMAAILSDPTAVPVPASYLRQRRYSIVPQTVGQVPVFTRSSSQQFKRTDIMPAVVNKSDSKSDSRFESKETKGRLTRSNTVSSISSGSKSKPKSTLSKSSSNQSLTVSKQGKESKHGSKGPKFVTLESILEPEPGPKLKIKKQTEKREKTVEQPVPQLKREEQFKPIQPTWTRPKFKVINPDEEAQHTSDVEDDDEDDDDDDKEKLNVTVDMLCDICCQSIQLSDPTVSCAMCQRDFCRHCFQIPLTDDWTLSLPTIQCFQCHFDACIFCHAWLTKDKKFYCGQTAACSPADALVIKLDENESIS